MAGPGEALQKPEISCVRKKKGNAQKMMGAHPKDPEAGLNELSLAKSEKM